MENISTHTVILSNEIGNENTAILKRTMSSLKFKSCEAYKTISYGKSVK